MCFLDKLVVCPYSTVAVELWKCTIRASFYIGAGDLNLDFHVWAVGTLPAKTFPYLVTADISIRTLFNSCRLSGPEKTTGVEWCTHFAIIWSL